MKEREIGEVFCYHFPDRSVFLRIDNCEAADPCKGCYFDKLVRPFVYCEKDFDQTGSCNDCLRKDNNNVIFRKVYAPKKINQPNQNNMENTVIAENYSEEWIKGHCCDYGKYPLVIKKGVPDSFIIPNHPEYFSEPPADEDVKIKISTFRGTCSDAIHYYATINVNQPEICSIDKCGRKLIHGGYICQEWKEMPKEITDNFGGFYTIVVQREVTENEINEYPDRWRYYRPGCKTTSFYSAGEALRIAKIIAVYRFPGRNVRVEE